MFLKRFPPAFVVCLYFYFSLLSILLKCLTPTSVFFFFFLSTQAFAPEFRERMTQLGQLLKQLERAHPQREILTAGEPEYRATVRSDREVC